MSNFSDKKHKIARQQLGLFFAQRREEMGLTPSIAAKFLGITENTLQRIEEGNLDFELSLLFRIYEALEIKPYFSTTKQTEDEDYSLKRNDDPERYHGFYICENIMLHPNQVAILKLTYPRVFLMFNYADSFFIDYDDWKNNHTDLQWLDADDKPSDDEEIEDVLTDCWNFLALHEQEEEQRYNDED